MNIFVLSEDPVQAARDQCNKHVCKMTVESAQMLCTALTPVVGATKLPYRPTHAQHPCTRWASESPANMAWLFAHATELSQEYTRRYGRRHKTQAALDSIVHLLPTGARWQDHTPFVLAMPERCRDVNAVTAYRNYYIAEKASFARWAPHAVAPSWWPFAEKQESRQ